MNNFSARRLRLTLRAVWVVVLFAMIAGLLAITGAPKQAIAGDSAAKPMAAAAPLTSGGSYASSSISARGIDLGPLTEADSSAADAPLAPIVGTRFEGFGYDDNGTEIGTFSIPPDPHGAAGTDRVLAVVNKMIEARSKTGTLIFRDSLKDFFSPLGAATLGTLAFDPKVIYDQFENRFVVVTLELTDTARGDASNRSRILLAVSKDSTPDAATATHWNYFSIDSKTSINGVDSWADYPGFEVDEEAIYVTNNMFSFGTRLFQGVRLWIVPKGATGGFYGGSAASVTVHNPFTDPDSVPTTAQPCQVYGAAGIGSGGLGNYLVAYGGVSDGTNELVQVVRVDNPLGAVTLTHEFVNVGNIDNGVPLPNAPQSGTSTLISTGDPRALDCVWRGNQIWLTATINPGTGPDAGQATAHWFKLNTSAVPGGAIVLSDQGNIGGEDIANGSYTFYPSVAVNANGDAMFGFAASAPITFAGAFAAGRESGDAAGTVQTPLIVKAGEASYVRTFGSSRNRWGDYSGISVDPANDTDFWVFNEFADVQGSTFNEENGRWGTAWARVSFPAAGTAPVVQSVARGDPSPTNSASVSFTVSFDQAVTGVNAADFSLTATGLSGASVASVSGSGATRTVLVNTGTGSGTLRLDVVDDDSIVATAGGLPLGGTGNGNGNFVTGEVYAIDKAAPTATIAVASGQPNPTSVSPILFTVQFNESTTQFSSADVVLSGTAGATTNAVSGSGGTYTVSVSGMTASGTVIARVRAAAIQDAAGNPSTASGTATVNYQVAPPAGECTGVTVTNSCAVNGLANRACLGTAGNDTIVGSGVRDVIQGAAGVDTIDGLGGDDLICGTDGNDILRGGDGNDVLIGGKGNDRVEGGNGNDRLDGNDGVDDLRGGNGNDTLNGGTGKDSCKGDAGTDTASACETKSGIP